MLSHVADLGRKGGKCSEVTLSLKVTTTLHLGTMGTSRDWAYLLNYLHTCTYQHDVPDTYMYICTNLKIPLFVLIT